MYPHAAYNRGVKTYNRNWPTFSEPQIAEYQCPKLRQSRRSEDFPKRLVVAGYARCRSQQPWRMAMKSNGR
jgi:hypothetical protein